MEPAEIVNKARQLRSEVVPMGSREPTPVIRVAQLLGYTVREFEPNDTTEMISGMVTHEIKTIFVNARETPERRRFTIAHEIGHIVVHGTDQSFVDFRQQGVYGYEDLDAEAEANRFAAELLMPQDLFESYWSAYGGHIASIAERLQVSKAAVAARSRSLGLVPA